MFSHKGTNGVETKTRMFCPIRNVAAPGRSLPSPTASRSLSELRSWVLFGRPIGALRWEARVLWTKPLELRAANVLLCYFVTPGVVVRYANMNTHSWYYRAIASIRDCKTDISLCVIWFSNFSKVQNRFSVSNFDFEIHTIVFGSVCTMQKHAAVLAVRV